MHHLENFRMKKVIVIRHVPFEDLGYFGPKLNSLGYSISYLDAGKDDLSLVDSLDPDLLVICGGPISVNEEELYPFLHDEFRVVAKRIYEEKPILGICLGAQIIAKVLGSRVYSSGTKEIGWFPIFLTEEGKNSPLHYLHHDHTYVFHWHGETFDLPLQATLLASTPICKNQAFAIGTHTLALQFHPEVIPLHLEQWYIGHTCELSHTKQISLDQLRKEAKLWGSKMQKQGEQFLQEWIHNFNRR